ncbi:hypothetical protein VCR17J2_420029 [Vibrio coralliirubri]|nr:hypothetical protein VCR17J2_420029 [Vibrio coralliirubri]
MHLGGGLHEGGIDGGLSDIRTLVYVIWVLTYLKAGSANLILTLTWYLNMKRV